MTTNRTGVLFLLLIISSHLIGIDAKISTRVLLKGGRLAARDNTRAKTRQLAKTRGITNTDDVTADMVMSAMRGEVCFLLDGDAASEADAIQQCFDDPPTKPDDCNGDNAPKCKQYDDCQVYLNSVKVSQSTRESMPAKPKELQKLDVEATNFVQLESHTKIAVIDDLLMAVAIFGAAVSFIDELIKWFTPAELSADQQRLLNAWMDYAKQVIRISKRKVEEYSDIVKAHPPASSVSLTADLDELRTAVRQLTDEIERITALLKQVVTRRAEEMTTGGTVGAWFSFGISYAVFCKDKTNDIESMHKQAMCGVDVLQPKILAVKTAMDALHADISMKILKAISGVAVSAPVYA